MEFEKRGILTTTVCTSQFATLLKSTSRTSGYPDLGIVVVSHPVAGIDPAEIRKKAEGVFGDIVSIIMNPLKKAS